MSVYDGLADCEPVSEKGRASHAELPSCSPAAYV